MPNGTGTFLLPLLREEGAEGEEAGQRWRPSAKEIFAKGLHEASSCYKLGEGGVERQQACNVFLERFVSNKLCRTAVVQIPEKRFHQRDA